MKRSAKAPGPPRNDLEATLAKQLADLPEGVRSIMQALPIPNRISILLLLEKQQRSIRLGLSTRWADETLLGHFLFARRRGLITELQFDVLANYRPKRPTV